MSSVSANGDDVNLTTTHDNVDLSQNPDDNIVNINKEDQKNEEDIAAVNKENSDDDLEASLSLNSLKSTDDTSHYAKYVKVGKYKIKIWSDDSFDVEKYKVRKYLKSHVKKAHKFKVHGYKFKVPAKMYRKILYYNKYGYDGKMGYANFKVKTNKYYTYKEPIYKTKKVTKKVWVHKKVLSGWARWGDGWYDDEYYSLSKYYKNGWESYGYSDKEYSNGADYYVKLKKKVKRTITKDVFVGYKKVKLRVYAYGMLSHYDVAVQFWGLKHGQKYAPITNYCRLK